MFSIRFLCCVLIGLLAAEESAFARVKSNTQVKLPHGLYLADLDGDGLNEFIQVSGVAGKGNANRVFVNSADFAATAISHLYLDTDVMRVFTGNFMLSKEPNYGPDQLCTILANGSFNCYFSADHKTLKLLWSQPNFISPAEEIIVGDFDGNGADDLLLYNSRAGTFRMVTRTNRNGVVGTGFGYVEGFHVGNLTGDLANLQLRVFAGYGQSGIADDLIAYDPANGRVIRWDAVIDATGPTFWWAFTAAIQFPSGPSRVQVSAANLDGTKLDALVFRDTLTGVYQFYKPIFSAGQLTPLTGISAGQLPVTAHAGVTIWSRLGKYAETGGSVRDDQLFFDADGTFTRTDARYDSVAPLTYWFAFRQNISIRDQGWAPLVKNNWVILKCALADDPARPAGGRTSAQLGYDPAVPSAGYWGGFPKYVDPLIQKDVFVKNLFSKTGAGMNGVYDYYLENTQGGIAFSNVDVKGWFPTAVDSGSCIGSKSTNPANSLTCPDSAGKPNTVWCGVCGNPCLDGTTCSSRGNTINACMTAAASAISLKPYDGFIILWSHFLDTGSVASGTPASPGRLMDLDANWFSASMQVVAHELGHAYGLQAHSHSDYFSTMNFAMSGDKSGATDYMDPTDPMGAAQNFNPAISSYWRPEFNPGVPAGGSCGTGCGLPLWHNDLAGFGAFNLDRMGLIPVARRLTLTPKTSGAQKSAVIKLVSPRRPEQEGYQLIKIPNCNRTTGVCPIANDYYTVEFRQKTGWDANFAEEAVVVHHVVGPEPANPYLVQKPGYVYPPGSFHLTDPVPIWREGYYLKGETAKLNRWQTVTVQTIDTGGNSAASVVVNY